MKGGHVVEHYSFTMLPHEAETMRRLLVQVEADDGFPLNEHEEELIAEFLRVIQPHDDAAVT